MIEPSNQLPSSSVNSPASTGAIIEHLKQAIAAGEHWYIALLEAIGLWTASEETHNGHTCRYLIADEAFDWLLLAQRICEEVDVLLPDDEKMDLLFYGKPPLDLPSTEFRRLVGTTKYRQYLNYFYGVTVEEALILAVHEEVRKENRSLGYNKEYATTSNEVYRRIYGATKAVLLKRFRKEKGYPQLKSISFAGLNEFTYWLFKYRLERCDKAKVASDTRKALDQIKRLQTIKDSP